MLTDNFRPLIASSTHLAVRMEQPQTMPEMRHLEEKL